MKNTMLILFLFGGLFPVSAQQEVRVSGNMLILGYIDDPFIGAGIGIESGIGTHFTLNADGNWGSHAGGSALELRPAVNYYFGVQQQGVFIGAAFKYISLNEKDETITGWENKLYSIGFNLGVKALVSEAWTLTVTASPHKTVGGPSESDVAGISAQLAIGRRF